MSATGKIFDHETSEGINDDFRTVRPSAIGCGNLADRVQSLAPAGAARPAARVPPRHAEPGSLARVRHVRRAATRRGEDRRCCASGRGRRSRSSRPAPQWPVRLQLPGVCVDRAEAGGVRGRRWPRPPAQKLGRLPGGRVMALHIVTAEERLAEANSKTTVAIFGPPGVGKTSLLWTLLGEHDALRRPRGRHEERRGLAGRQHPDPQLARCRRHRLPDRRRGSLGRPERVLLGRATTSMSPGPIRTWSS